MSLKNWKDRQAKLELRASKIEEMGKIDAAADGKPLTDEQRTQFDALETEVQEIDAVIQRFDRLSDLKHGIDDQRSDPDGREPGREDHGQDEQRSGLLAEVPERDRKRYSVLRIIQARAASRPLDGLEAELSQEIAQRSGKDPEGAYVPFDLPIESRDLTTSTGAGAVGTSTARTLIGLLQARTLVASLGATMMTGLRDSLSLPKQTAAPAGAWVAEGSAPAEGDITIGQVGLSPNSLRAWTKLSQKFIKQSSVDAEQFARNELVNTLRRLLDQAVLNGSGSGAEPEGILQNSSVPTVAIATNGGAITWAHVVDLETELADDNADMGSLAYVTTSKGRGAMKKTQKVAGEARFIWENNMVNDYPARATNLLPSNLTKGSGTALSPVLYGNFADVIIGMWGGMDLIVNPYTGDTEGIVRVTAGVEADVAYRHDESFAKVVDLDPTA
ncbi:MAG: phage major capsid protein [Planctomycetota bacterium]